MNLSFYKPHVKLDVRKFFFSVRVVVIRNSLPEIIIKCTTVNKFKKQIDYCLKEQGVLLRPSVGGLLS